jgi:hypothetical protein
MAGHNWVAVVGRRSSVEGPSRGGLERTTRRRKSGLKIRATTLRTICCDDDQHQASSEPRKVRILWPMKKSSLHALS